MVVSVLLAFGWVIGMLIAASRFAQSRSRDPTSSSDQSWRILVPAFAFTLGLATYTLLAFAGRAEPVFVIGAIIVVLFINGPASLLVIALTDVAAMTIGARRTRTWLLIGAAIYAGVAALALLARAGAFTGRGFAALLEPDLVALIAFAVVAALIWWSFLPAEPGVAGVFE